MDCVHQWQTPLEEELTTEQRRELDYAKFRYRAFKVKKCSECGLFIIDNKMLKDSPTKNKMMPASK